MKVAGPSTNLIALLSLFIATALMVYLFAGSRLDPSLRIAALVAGTGLVSTLAAISSTILTGKDLTKNHDGEEKDNPPANPQTPVTPAKTQEGQSK